MGYLDNTSITVDAILTKRGRELLAQGRNAFKITQFALADDEIDYDLWNPAHPLGKNYYGVAIESMPITEAVPDETQVMKYKLITLSKGTLYLPVIGTNVTSGGITLDKNTNNNPQIEVFTTVSKGTRAVNENANPNGYTATILDSTYVTIQGASSSNSSYGQVASSISYNVPVMTNDGKGMFNLSYLSNTTGQVKTTKLIITGNDTGGRVVLPITITPEP